ncbi:restriction endonuclease subunit S [Haemophilus influenzae]|uniref:restriction endonuclease subunit S n=1 Tax=Haemophilus influenzae TaxID=727 RepID=UPI0010A520D6|nr:restriction endonuclease subunit S [Haemophilus influenzae]MCK9086963.1 restriction endonuclease subunit S [Haemophilus influenzae]MCK9106575.1 restriction endonuclease subunit S [Haemophilus influenzae]
MSDWKEYKLGELATFYNGRAYKNGEFKTSGTPIVRIQNLTGEGKTVYSDLQLDENKYIENGDLIYAWSATFGPYIWRGEKSIYHYHIWKIVCNEKIIDKFYFYYKLKLISDSLKDNGNGSIFIHITKSFMENFKIKIPSLEKQKYISNILSNLDKKIRFNTQINQTLEQIAQALFKSWFVDFDPVRAKVQALSDGLSLEQAELAAMQAISGKTPEELTALSQTQPERYAKLAETAKAFPCEMVEIDGVEVPKGWELSTIGDCYDVVMGQSPKGETYNENKQGMLFYQGRAEFGWRFPTPRLFTTDPKRIAEQNSILMSVRAPVGDINIALEKCCIGRGLAALQHKSKSLSFGLYQIQSIKSELDLFNGEGTVFGSINQANLKNIQIINPDEKFIQLFEKNLSSCDSKIMNNEIENNALKEIRDLLLPRLLSGEI